MKQIEEFFREAPPGPLYHYTGIGSVLGMAQSQVIWASHAYYLNDSQEVVHACQILQDHIEPRLIFGNRPDTEIQFLKQLSKWIKTFNQNPYNIFIFSLSEENSLLSQWRSYTPHGKGVSVGFSPNTIRSIAEDSEAVLVKCAYEPAQQNEIIHSLLEKILITFNTRKATIDLSSEHIDNLYFGFLEEFRQDFLRVLCIIKHPAFKEEKEWRIISRYFPNDTTPELKFREGASMLVPYIQFKLPSDGKIFEKVFLGPSQHANLSMSALAMYLSNKGLCSHTVNCDIPYREW